MKISIYSLTAIFLVLLTGCTNLKNERFYGIVEDVQYLDAPKGQEHDYSYGHKHIRAKIKNTKTDTINDYEFIDVYSLVLKDALVSIDCTTIYDCSIWTHGKYNDNKLSIVEKMDFRYAR